MVTVKPIGYLEYVIVFASCRTPLSDYYVKYRGERCQILGAYGEDYQGVGILIGELCFPVLEIWYVGTVKSGSGMGKALVQAAISMGRERSFQSLRMRINTSNSSYEALRGLAESCGFSSREEVELFHSDWEKRKEWQSYMNVHGNRMLDVLAEAGFRGIPFSQVPREQWEELSKNPSFDDFLNPGDIFRGYKGSFCRELSYLSLYGQNPAAYCLVCRPDETSYVFEIISEAEEYQNTGVIFQAFALSANAVIQHPYRRVGFAMYRQNKKALALSGRLMRRIISGREVQYQYEYELGPDL